MDRKEKKELSEQDICDLFITTATKNAAWDKLLQIRRGVTLTPGPVVVRDNMYSRFSVNQILKVNQFVLT